MVGVLLAVVPVSGAVETPFGRSDVCASDAGLLEDVPFSERKAFLGSGNRGNGGHDVVRRCYRNNNAG